MIAFAAVLLICTESCGAAFGILSVTEASSSSCYCLPNTGWIFDHHQDKCTNLKRGKNYARDKSGLHTERTFFLGQSQRAKNDYWEADKDSHGDLFVALRFPGMMFFRIAPLCGGLFFAAFFSWRRWGQDGAGARERGSTGARERGSAGARGRGSAATVVIRKSKHKGLPT